LPLIRRRRHIGEQDNAKAHEEADTEKRICTQPASREPSSEHDAYDDRGEKENVGPHPVFIGAGLARSDPSPTGRRSTPPTRSLLSRGVRDSGPGGCAAVPSGRPLSLARASHPGTRLSKAETQYVRPVRRKRWMR
jgi:hypothetical protein